MEDKAAVIIILFCSRCFFTSFSCFPFFSRFISISRCCFCTSLSIGILHINIFGCRRTFTQSFPQKSCHSALLLCEWVCLFHCSSSSFVFIAVTAAPFTIRFIVVMWVCCVCECKRRCGGPNHETSQPAKFICRISFDFMSSHHKWKKKRRADPHTHTHTHSQSVVFNRKIQLDLLALLLAFFSGWIEKVLLNSVQSVLHVLPRNNNRLYWNKWN